MLYSYNWLQEYIGKKLPKPEKLAELLSLHAFEIEEVKKQGSDWIFDIAVLPNRAHDCAGHQGMAREIAVLTGLPLALPKRSTIKTQKSTLGPMKVTIQAKSFVPRYSALVIEGVHPKQSPKWLKERLEAAGVNSINSIVDITNFVMLETGQPLHAFDYDSIRGKTMTVRQAKEKEKLETLDNITFSLPQGALVIEDKEGLIDLVGIKGGKISGITSATKNIVLQAATFDPTIIYKTKKQLHYTTQAADIYAAGIDSERTTEALERAWTLLKQVGNGKVAQIIDIYPAKIRPATIFLNSQLVEKILGVAVPQEEMKRILKGLGFEIKQTSQKRGVWQIQVPSRRMDVSMPEDLVEEIGRIHGYNAIPSKFPVLSLQPHERSASFVWRERIRDLMKEAGFTEIYTYSFLGEKDKKRFGYQDKETKKIIELENPLSEEVAYLRTNLLPNLLKQIAVNQKRYRVINIFELGTVYAKEKESFQEKKELSGISIGKSFYEMKGIVDFLCESMGITDVWYDNYQQTPELAPSALWHSKKSVEIKIGDEEIGFVGEIAKSILSNLKIDYPVAAFSLDEERISKFAQENIAYQLPSRFPASVRDIAVLVPFQTKVVDIMNMIEGTAGEIIQDVDLFDMYEGPELPAEKKNFAFHIVYQASDRTLTAEEIDAIHNKIIKNLEQNPDWEVRK
ncbi:MAG: phenylalanine--tRNA ligase subunit beta [Candidatus Wildermuthbacteria bacterium]|nr:phenylalanine--tRNA ligase subunit beta [Candidatus Wildermuthbacteria bacterium]